MSMRAIEEYSSSGTSFLTSPFKIGFAFQNSHMLQSTSSHYYYGEAVVLKMGFVCDVALHWSYFLQENVRHICLEKLFFCSFHCSSHAL